ncbi:hypothetical protein [Delftia phage PhiW-14]|uniref:Uncharacterized protein n=1 Tax=Delftia phage PhiW-14 TaxID=665032 RepID=C9DGG3_BPW14|nr:hypothetical protein DP-phiW-14_gp193 [Delftia phage PhiW-14]ACV50214.1 hypothetical protein [Delftia phage PhiW-14]
MAKKRTSLEAIQLLSVVIKNAKERLEHADWQLYTLGNRRLAENPYLMEVAQGEYRRSLLPDYERTEVIDYITPFVNGKVVRERLCNMVSGFEPFLSWYEKGHPMPEAGSNDSLGDYWCMYPTMGSVINEKLSKRAWSIIAQVEWLKEALEAYSMKPAMKIGEVVKAPIKLTIDTKDLSELKSLLVESMKRASEDLSSKSPLRMMHEPGVKTMFGELRVTGKGN